jgi:hypothetical protein
LVGCTTGATAEEVKAAIKGMIEEAFGGAGVSAIQQQAMADAAYQHYEWQTA